MLQLAHRAKPGRRTVRPSHPTTFRNWYYPDLMPVSRRAFLGAVPAALAAQSAAPAAINRRDVVSRHNPTLRALDPRSPDRKSTRLNSSHRCISYAVFCLTKKHSAPGIRQRSSNRRGGRYPPVSRQSRGVRCPAAQRQWNAHQDLRSHGHGQSRDLDHHGRRRPARAPRREHYSGRRPRRFRPPGCPTLARSAAPRATGPGRTPACRRELWVAVGGRTLRPNHAGRGKRMTTSTVRRLLLAYAALNAVLYSMLLPLWEGFDEPFHFGYVQQLANGQGLPDARSARLSREVWQAILRAPASDPVKANLPDVVTYAEYFSWPSERRSAAQ